MQIKVAPSILDCDLTRLAESVAEVKSGGVDMHHIDVQQKQHFVPNIMAGPQLTAAVCRCARVPVNVHLMISDPVRYAPYFIKASAHSVLFHVEAVDDLPAAVEAIRAHGAKVGVALKPDTPAEAIAALIGMLDCLMAMTVQPGFSGPNFMEEGCHKIPELRRMLGSDIDIYVDGGIGPPDGAPGGALRGRRAGRLLGRLPGGRGPGGGGCPGSKKIGRAGAAGQPAKQADRHRDMLMFGRTGRQVPDGLFIKCDGCGTLVYRKSVEERLQASPECNYHFRIGAWAPREDADGRGQLPGDRRGPGHQRPAGLRGRQGLQGPIPRSLDRSGLNEAVAERHLHDQEAAGRLRGDGLRLLRRQHGQRGRGRRSSARPSWPPRGACPW